MSIGEGIGQGLMFLAQNISANKRADKDAKRELQMFNLRQQAQRQSEIADRAAKGQALLGLAPSLGLETAGLNITPEQAGYLDLGVLQGLAEEKQFNDAITANPELQQRIGTLPKSFRKQAYTDYLSEGKETRKAQAKKDANYQNLKTLARKGLIPNMKDATDEELMALAATDDGGQLLGALSQNQKYGQSEQMFPLLLQKNQEAIQTANANQARIAASIDKMARSGSGGGGRGSKYSPLELGGVIYGKIDNASGKSLFNSEKDKRAYERAKNPRAQSPKGPSPIPVPQIKIAGARI